MFYLVFFFIFMYFEENYAIVYPFSVKIHTKKGARTTFAPLSNVCI